MISFIKKYSLTCILLLSITIVIINVNLLAQGTAGTAKEIINVVDSVALSYIAAYIFYILQVYIPDRQNHKKVNQNIWVYVNQIVGEIDNAINLIAEQYIGHTSYERPFTKEEMLQKIVMNTGDILSNASDVNSLTFDKNGEPRWEHSDVRGWLLQETSIIETKIDKLIQTYGFYLSPDLLTGLENVRSTPLMSNAMRSMLAMPESIGFDRSNNSCFYKFYEAGRNLEEVAEIELK